MAWEVTHRTVIVNGIKMHVAEQGSGPALLLIHGFPDLWHSWRHQMEAVAEAGYHALAPDMRGYGDTDVPLGAQNYTAFHIVGDLIALLDALGHQKEPGRVEEEFASYGCTEVVKRFFLTTKTDLFAAAPNERILESLGTPTNIPSWITEEEIQYYGKQFEKTGFTGGLNYYRALDLNWELLTPWTGASITVPAKYIVGDKDLVYTTPGIKNYVHGGGLKKTFPFLEEVVVIEGGHHFIQQEKPHEISRLILEFFKKFKLPEKPHEISRLILEFFKKFKLPAACNL